MTAATREERLAELRRHGATLADQEPPITDAQAEAAARIFVAVERREQNALPQAG